MRLSMTAEPGGVQRVVETSRAARVFLLSPAHCGGQRASFLLRPGSNAPQAQALRAGALTLGAAFSFMSGLYFRGKLTYATAFGRGADAGGETIFVITPTRGLQPPALIVTADLIREFAGADVDERNPDYRHALERDVAALARRLTPAILVILLGSIATGKYVDVLGPLLGDRLRFPPAFIGRGDMSRGGLLLRSAESGVELDYAALQTGTRPRGPRPPKLAPLRRPSS